MYYLYSILSSTKHNNNEMGLSNAAQRANCYSTLIVRNQGGGPKKAGLPPTVDFNHAPWRKINLGGRHLDMLSSYLQKNQTPPVQMQNMPTGSDVRIRMR